MNKTIENEFHTVRGYQLKKQNESRLTPALEDYRWRKLSVLRPVWQNLPDSSSRNRIPPASCAWLSPPLISDTPYHQIERIATYLLCPQKERQIEGYLPTTACWGKLETARNHTINPCCCMPGRGGDLSPFEPPASAHGFPCRPLQKRSLKRLCLFPRYWAWRSSFAT